MKGSIAAIITACERFFARQNSFAGSVSLLITSDEEGVAIDGTRYALDQLVNRSELNRLLFGGRTDIGSCTG